MRSNRNLFCPRVESAVRSGLVCVLFAVFATDCRPVWAASDVWTRIGPDGGSITSVAIDPQNPNIVYALSDGSSFAPTLFKSADSGANWTASSTLPVVSRGFLNALAIDSKTPSTIFVYGWSGVFKSTDGGVTWQDTALPAFGVGTYGMGTYFQRGGAVTLAIDSQNSGVVYAGSKVCEGLCGGRVFKSTDAAHTWMSPNFVFTDRACSQTISAVAVDPRTPSTVFATTTDCNDQGGDLFKSTDGGTTWKKTTLHLFTYDEPSNVIAIEPQNPNRIHVGTGYGIATSTDGGESWTSTNFLVNSGRPEQFLVTSLALDRQNPGTMYAAGYTSSPSPLPVAGIFKSDDAGLNWTPFSNGLTGVQIRSLAVSPSTPRTVYAGTSGGVFRVVDTAPALSLDSVQYCVPGSWKLKVSNGASNALIRLLGTSNGEAWEVQDWRKTDGDGNWSEAGVFAVGTEGRYFLRVAIDRTLSNVVSFVVSNCGP